MAQVRRRPHYRSPPARQIPTLPNPIRFQPPTNRKIFPIQAQNVHFDPVSGLILAGNTSEQSLQSFSSSSNQVQTPGKQQQQNGLEESIILPQLNDDDELLGKKHLPVYAQFPFDISVSINKKTLPGLFFLLLLYFVIKQKERTDHILMR